MPRSHRGQQTRVAHVIQNLNYGGMERVLHALAERLPAKGFDVHIVVLQYLGRFSEGLEGTVTLHRVPPMRKLSILHPRRLINLLRQIEPDVVHSHTGVWHKASHAARAANVPAVVHTEHGRSDPVPLLDRLIDNHASRRTDSVIAVSDALGDLLRRQVMHDPRRIRVITNGVDHERLRPPEDQASLRRELGIPPDVPVIGSVGRLEPVKNYALAVRAFARLLRRGGSGSAPLLVLAGDGSERLALERLARTLGIASRVMFLGWRPDGDRFYGAFDLFTLTSTSEGTSISLLEAMSTGTCPVVTDVGGNRAVLGAELSSLIVPSEDESALAGVWHAQLADPASRRRFGALARVRVTTDFSLERMVEAHVELYRQLVAREGVRRSSVSGSTGIPAA